MDDVKFIVTTHDKFMWAVQPFAYLFNIYWSAGQRIEVLCESTPPFKLPQNFSYHVIDVEGEGWPKSKWTDGYIKYLHGIKEQIVVHLLEDYWLNRTVDVTGIRTFCDYMRSHPNVIRFDLTMDRLYAEGPKYPIHDPPYAHYGHYDLFSRPGTPYQMSLQAAIWNKSLLLEILKPGWSPWEVELRGTELVNKQADRMLVLGTRQNPVSYTNALKNESELVNTRDIPEEHRVQIRRFFPGREEHKGE